MIIRKFVAVAWFNFETSVIRQFLVAGLIPASDDLGFALAVWTYCVK